MSNFLFVAYDCFLKFAIYLFSFSLLFCLALGHLLRESRLACDRLHAQIDGYIAEVDASHSDSDRLQRECDVLNAATDIFIFASAELERERNGEDHG